MPSCSLSLPANASADPFIIALRPSHRSAASHASLVSHCVVIILIMSQIAMTMTGMMTAPMSRVSSSWPSGTWSLCTGWVICGQSHESHESHRVMSRVTLWSFGSNGNISIPLLQTWTNDSACCCLLHFSTHICISSTFPRWVGVMSRAARLGSIIIPRYYPDQPRDELIMWCQGGWGWVVVLCTFLSNCLTTGLLLSGQSWLGLGARDSVSNDDPMSRNIPGRDNCRW